MQSISPSKGTAAGNTRSHGNAEGAATLPLWTLETCLPEQAERVYEAVCSAGRVLPFATGNACHCCHCACHAELTVSSRTARPSVQTDSNLPVVATCPCNGPPAGKQERCPPP